MALPPTNPNSLKILTNRQKAKPMGSPEEFCNLVKYPKKPELMAEEEGVGPGGIRTRLADPTRPGPQEVLFVVSVLVPSFFGDLCFFFLSSAIPFLG